MARFDTSGLTEIIQALEAVQDSMPQFADEALLASAQEVQKAWQDSAREHGHVDTGDMLKSITYPRKPKKAGDVMSIDIYPQGKDSKGVRNAEKAFVLHYGSSSIKGSHFVDDADEASGPLVEKAMTKVYDKLLKAKGLK